MYTSNVTSDLSIFYRYPTVGKYLFKNFNLSDHWSGWDFKMPAAIRPLFVSPSDELYSYDISAKPKMLSWKLLREYYLVVKKSFHDKVWLLWHTKGKIQYFFSEIPGPIWKLFGIMFLVTLNINSDIFLHSAEKIHGRQGQFSKNWGELGWFVHLYIV